MQVSQLVFAVGWLAIEEEEGGGTGEPLSLGAQRMAVCKCLRLGWMHPR